MGKMLDLDLNSEKSVQIKKEVYYLAIKKLEMKHESKRHLENKILNVLQAEAILIALFTALLQYTNKLDGDILNILKYLFYIFTIISILLLILALDDTIVNWFKKDKKDGLYEDTLEANEILGEALSNPDYFYDNIINDISRSSESAVKIIIRKDIYFKIATLGFIGSMIIIILIGMIIV